MVHYYTRCCDTIHEVLHPRTFPPSLVWGCDRRGGRRGARSGGRGSTNSHFVTQTTPTVDSEHVPKTQEADVNIDVEGDGLDMVDLDQILHDLSYLRESKYNEADILLCLNITQSQLK
uniref:Uncharacterized protein n=1 Tax=Lactuca sativa TaxID=4236 RepID=A0A9R1WM48_LACSA|nr:hypothetical protein LSAT_V11C100045640 [Lactuca sativa]